MNRDMDLIRSILLNVESDGKLGFPEGDTNEEIADHVLQLKENGFLEAVIVRNRESTPVAASIIRLTSKGTTF
jgi:Hypothetical protein (DUF2513)